MIYLILAVIIIALCFTWGSIGYCEGKKRGFREAEEDTYKKNYTLFSVNEKGERSL